MQTSQYLSNMSLQKRREDLLKEEDKEVKKDDDDDEEEMDGKRRDKEDMQDSLGQGQGMVVKISGMSQKCAAWC